MFNSARIKLTAWYLLIIMLISAAFSVVIYQEFSSEFTRLATVQRLRLERRYRDLGPENVPVVTPGFPDPELLEQSQERLAWALIFINGGILIFSGAIGFFLAGRTLEPIKVMLDEQNQFISDASHELRTPLTALKSSLEVTARDKNLRLGEAKKLLTTSIQEVNKLQKLAEGLLSLTQLSPQGIAKDSGQVSLSVAVAEAFKKVHPAAQEKHIILENAASNHTLLLPEEKLTELLVILLDNAVKYSPPQSQIQVSSQKKDHFVAIKITDQGMGIEENDLAHIFDRFYRADKARSKGDSGGYGLGLSIAKQITETYHGQISVESKPNRGSTFSVLLPFSQS